MKSKKVFLTILILIAVAVSVFFIYNYYSQSYVASVNGEKVSVGEFRLMLDTVGPRTEKNWGKGPNDLVAGKKVRDYEKEFALESIINYKVSAQKAKERGIVLTQQEIASVNQGIDNLISQNPKAKENLKNLGLSVGEFKEISAEIKLASKLKDQIYTQKNSKVSITDQEARDYYDKHVYQYSESFDMIKDKVKLDAEYNRTLDEWKKQSIINRNDSVYNSIK